MVLACSLRLLTAVLSPGQILLRRIAQFFHRSIMAGRSATFSYGQNIFIKINHLFGLAASRDC
jgi:hypothetical protein